MLSRAVKLDPFHPPWFHLAIAVYHLERNEHEDALAAARKIDMPGFAPPQGLLAVIYAELGRQSEAGSAVEELLRLRPGFTTKNAVDELRKLNFSDDSIRRFVAGLRKAGLPEGTEE